MKQIFLLGLSCMLFAMMPIQKKKKVIFFGDSITQAAVEKGGYIDRIGKALQQRGLAPGYELIGAGIGGNKVYDLYLRLEKDVLDKKPDIVFIYIGVNDVWHKSLLGTGTDADKFIGFYTALISKIRSAGATVILVTPAVIGEKRNGENAQDKDLDAYSESIRKLAAEQQCQLIDLRREFLDYNAGHNTSNAAKGILTTDGVHLNEAGNQLVADQMLRVLDNLK